MFRIKKALILLVVIIVSSFVISTAIIYAVASNYHRINSGQTAIIDEWGICKNVARTSSGDIFIPTKTQAEWEAFINNATGVNIANCGGGGGGDGVCGGISQVAGNDNVYNVIEIGTQCWFASNLNEGTVISNYTPQTDNAIVEKFCPTEGDTNSCDGIGGLYQWDELTQYDSTEGAQGICPTGWHISTDAEWHILENFLADGICAPNRNGSWDCVPAGTELKIGGTTGFDGNPLEMLRKNYPTGNPPGPSTTDFTESGARIWTSTILGSGAKYRILSSAEEGVYLHQDPKAQGYFARCIKN